MATLVLFSTKYDNLYSRSKSDIFINKRDINEVFQ